MKVSIARDARALARRMFLAPSNTTIAGLYSPAVGKVQPLFLAADGGWLTLRADGAPEELSAEIAELVNLSLRARCLAQAGGGRRTENQRAASRRNVRLALAARGLVPRADRKG